MSWRDLRWLTLAFCQPRSWHVSEVFNQMSAAMADEQWLHFMSNESTHLKRWCPQTPWNFSSSRKWNMLKCLEDRYQNESTESQNGLTARQHTLPLCKRSGHGRILYQIFRSWIRTPSIQKMVWLAGWSAEPALITGSSAWPIIHFRCGATGIVALAKRPVLAKPLISWIIALFLCRNLFFHGHQGNGDAHFSHLPCFYICDIFISWFSPMW